MNGVDAVLLATGNDWRAVEAGAHAYAARERRATARWRSGARDGGRLCAASCRCRSRSAPSAARCTSTPARAWRWRILGRLVGRATSAEVAAAAGLATNLAALRALATEGIQRGHMALHARAVARAAGATGELVERVAASSPRSATSSRSAPARSSRGCASSSTPRRSPSSST